MQSHSENTYQKESLISYYGSFMHFLGDGIEVHKAEVTQRTA